jgi:hypothetical protein
MAGLRLCHFLLGNARGLIENQLHNENADNAEDEHGGDNHEEGKI